MEPATKRPAPREIHILRCGGRHASVVYDAIISRCLDNNLIDRVSSVDANVDVALFQQSQFVVWDDSKLVHPSLEKLKHASCLNELVAYALMADANVHVCDNDSSDAHVDIDEAFLLLNVYICHGSSTVRRKLVLEMEEQVNRWNSNNSTATNKKVQLKLSLSFPTVIHPTSFVSPSSKLGRGSFVGPHALVHTSAVIGDFCIINSMSNVEHDCIVGAYCNINPGGTLCGTVTLGEGTTIGAGATVRDHVSIAAATVVGMQAGVVGDVLEENAVMLGVPSKNREKNMRNQDHVNVGTSAAVSSHTTLVQMQMQKQGQVAATLSDKAKGGEEMAVEKDTLDENDTLRWCYKKKFSIDRFHKYLSPSLAKGHLTNDGPLQKVASAKLQQLCGSNSSTRKVLLTASGTAALHTLAAAWEMKRGKRLRWVTQSFTFPSAIQGPMSDSIVVDMDAEHGGPSLKQLEELEKEFDGVVVTNCFGQPNDVLAYERWCKDHCKLLLLDNAATPISFVDDDGVSRCIHDIGDGAFVSLHETKPIGRGEGGAIFVPPQLVTYSHRAMNFGFNVYLNERCPHRYASNWRMSDFAAAVICDHIDSVTQDSWVARQQELIEHLFKHPSYGQTFEMKRNVSFPTLLSCIFLTAKVDVNMDAVSNYLIRCVPSIEAKRYYRPLSSSEEAPLSWELFDRSICLPFHVGITKQMLDYALENLVVAITMFSS